MPLSVTPPNGVSGSALPKWLMLTIPASNAFDTFVAVCKEFVKTYGFEKVSDPKKGDLLIFAVESSVGNHGGVYLGNNMFFHHAVNRLSCRENMGKLWLESLVGVYRYVA